MKSKKMEYCPICHDYHPQIIRSRMRDIMVNGEDVMTAEKYLYCPKRDKNYMSYDMVHSNFERASVEYQKLFITKHEKKAC